MPLSPEQRQQIANALQERGANRACEACGNGEFAVADEIAQLRIAPMPNMIGGPTIPAAAVVCRRCGNVRFHALGLLNLLALGRRNG